jgi:DNA (cytosine-5)-methyltransferase 1
VFVVASSRDGFDPAEVLFEREGLRRNTPPSREQGKEVAATVAQCFDRQRSDEYGTDDVASTMSARDYKAATGLVTQPIAFEPGKLKRLGYGDAEPGLSPTLRADAGDNQLAVAQPIPLDMMNIKGRPSDDNRIGRGYGEEGDPMLTITKANHHWVAQPITFGAQMSNPQTDVDMVQTLGAKNPMAVTYSIMPMNSGKDYKAREADVAQPVLAGGPSGGNQGGDYVMQSMAYASYGGVVRKLEDVMSTLDAARESRGTNQQRFIHQHMAVRRLTPRECERLQGFPDDYTAIPKAADGPRYKALGNSMAVPIMAWIGERIAREIGQ